MAPILEKAYANALLFGVGLMLGTATESPERYAKPRQEEQAPAQADKPQTERGKPAKNWARSSAESEELALLRRAEAELFADMKDSLGDREVVVRDAPLACPIRTQRSPAGLQSSMGDTSEAATDFWAGLDMPTVPVKQDPRVAKYIRYFTQSKEGRNVFLTWLRRSGKYREIVLESLRAAQVPQDLIALVFIESGFGPTAVSTAGATGMWQFMPKTARAYGLTVDRRYDERRAIWKSTAAATRHLADLHDFFQSWDLALAAYNYGHQRLADLMDQMATDDFWTLSRIEGALPRETALYVPKVLAVAVILNNLDRFGFGDVKPENAIEATEMEVPAGVRLSMLARASGTSLEAVRALNPEYRSDVIPDLGGPALVHLPSAGLARARVMLPRLIDDAERDTRDLEVPAGFDWGRDDLNGDLHKRLDATAPSRGARRSKLSGADGDGRRDGASTRYFGSLAPQHSMERLARASTAEPGTGAEKPKHDTMTGGMSSDSPVLVSESPVLASESSGASTPAAKAAADKPVAGHSAPKAKPRSPSRRSASRPRQGKNTVFYMASSGDTAVSVARVFGVSVDEVLRANAMRAGDQIIAGTLLRVPVDIPAVPERAGSARATGKKPGARSSQKR